MEFGEVDGRQESGGNTSRASRDRIVESGWSNAAAREELASTWRGGMLSAWLIGCALCCASTLSAAEIRIPSPDVDENIQIRGAAASQWWEGEREILLFPAGCELKQGTTTVVGQSAVVWVELGGEFGDRQNEVNAYFQGDVQVQGSGGRLKDKAYRGTFLSRSPLHIEIPHVLRERAEASPLFRQAVAYRPAASEVQQAQFEVDATMQPGQLGAGALNPLGGKPIGGGRRFRIFQRGDLPFQLESFRTGRGEEQVFIITQGVNLVVEGATPTEFGEEGTLDLMADRVVIWSTGGLDLQGQTPTDGQRPVELYLEGNIVFRQGERVVFADRMYYDVHGSRGVVLDAELYTPSSDFSGTIRLQADVLRQTAKDRFYAQRAYVTSSLMGYPNYRFQANEVHISDYQNPAVDRFTGEPIIDPETGQQEIDHQRFASSYNNTLRLGNVPVLYWPVFAADIQKPEFYLRRIRFKNDNINGFSVLTDWKLYQLLGIRNPPVGTDLNLSVDYLSARGPAGGVEFEYQGENIYGVPGQYQGFLDTWFLHDTGTDTLGSDRRDLTPDKEFRGRLLGQHRQQLPDDFQLTAEFGWISDRNFLEMFYETEWDEFKDQATAVELKQIRDNRSWSIYAAGRVNDQFTQTEWLPRLDHFWLGQSLLGDRLTWYEHSSIGYGKLRVGKAPETGAELARFTPLPWETTSSGLRAVTTQELNMPLNVGPVKVVPYVLGQLAHWGEDLTGNTLDRGYFQAGLRASVPWWTSDPSVESNLWNLHGMAHKVVLDVDAYVAQADEQFTGLPLYDPLDDDSTEHFRRRIPTNTFNGNPTPLQFDERFYALRYGLASSVTSPSAEIADDLQAVRVGLRQRWQTKRGMPGARRVVDWITLDTEAVYFPKAGEDNFGENLGLMGYDFQWNIGERFSILSDGAIDLFDQGQEVVTIGALLTRPTRGSFYAGFRWLEGPINSKVITTSYQYSMSPKWYSSFSTSFDLGPGGNIGQSVYLTRIGESFH